MKKEIKPPYFPFYPKDFTSDGNVELMTTEQIGAYMLLLCKAWHEKPIASIPDDDKILAKWAKLDLKKWRSMRRIILHTFTRGDNGRWYQKRLAHEATKLMDYLKCQTEAGRRGAEKRWKTQGDYSKPIAEGWQAHSNQNQNQNQIDNKRPLGTTSNNGLFLFKEIMEQIKKHLRQKNIKREINMAESDILKTMYIYRPQQIMAMLDLWFSHDQKWGVYARAKDFHMVAFNECAGQIRDDKTLRGLTLHYNNKFPDTPKEVQGLLKTKP